MEKVRYMISDAANIVNVESHVLRYWEDELELNVPRNELGHRYYTKENIQEFQRIKELKEQTVANAKKQAETELLQVKEEGETLKKKACEKTKQETEALKALAQGKEEEAVSAVMKALL